MGNTTTQQKSNNSPPDWEKFKYRIATWLYGDANSITENLSQMDIEYIVNNMSHMEDGHMFRLETSRHLNKWLDEGNDVGDLLNGNGLFRSFSRTGDASAKMLKNGWVPDNDIVVYRTVGTVPFFDPRPFTNPFPEQEEAFVPLDCMRVERITRFGSDEFEELGEFMGTTVLDDVGDVLTNVGGVDEYTDSVTVVDVRFDPSVKKVVDSDGYEVDVSGF